MDQSRRKFFGMGAALAAMSGIPVGAQLAVKEKKEEAIKPILLEHVCDCGASRVTAEEIAEARVYYPWAYIGCGTRFQWYWGTNPMCPTCGFVYNVTLDDLKSGFYKRIS